MRNLWPTFEELFDSAEEHVLEELMSPWKELAKMDGHEVRNGRGTGLVGYTIYPVRSHNLFSFLCSVRGKFWTV